MGVTRLAQERDIVKIRDIAGRAGYIDYISDNVEEMIRKSGLFVYDDEGIKGFLQANFRKMCWISAIRVDPDFRRHGVAQRMVENIEEIGANRGCISFGALVTTDNVASQNMFKKLHYRVEESFVSVYGMVDGLKEEENFPMEKSNFLLDWEIWDREELESQNGRVRIYRDRNGNIYCNMNNTYHLLKSGSLIEIVEKNQFLSISNKMYEPHKTVGVNNENKWTFNNENKWTFDFFKKEKS
ncbi:MAG: GNAT family N-acetyltransferase [Cuniculiplasma sp.]